VNVVLIGYRGTGKSAVAVQLGASLQLKVVSLDGEIERRAGQRIPQIVEQRGWPGFRDLEEDVVRTFAARDGQVLDCGGGVVEREGNFEVLRRAGRVFWLKAAPATIVARIAGDDQRPSLTGKKSFTDEVEEVLQRRTPLYRRLAHHEVDTDSSSVTEVAQAVLALVDEQR
jgi:shikimate kinase